MVCTHDHPASLWAGLKLFLDAKGAALEGRTETSMHPRPCLHPRVCDSGADGDELKAEEGRREGRGGHLEVRRPASAVDCKACEGQAPPTLILNDTKRQSATAADTSIVAGMEVL